MISRPFKKMTKFVFTSLSRYFHTIEKGSWVNHLTALISILFLVAGAGIEPATS